MIFNSNEGKKKKKENIKRDDFIFKRDGFFLFFFNSNEDSGANFWVPFIMDPKF
jgi:hypothetical protein